VFDKDFTENMHLGTWKPPHQFENEKKDYRDDYLAKEERRRKEKQKEEEEIQKAIERSKKEAVRKPNTDEDWQLELAIQASLEEFK
jgi:hypothetical protein